MTLTQVQGGYRIKQTDEYYVDVMLMMFNWRLVVGLTEMDGLTYEHGYCYFGTDLGTFARAVAAGIAWTDPLNTDPEGFDKKAY